MIPPLSSSYVDARAAFLVAAEAAGARIESHPHPQLGLESEPLFVDVAELGRADAASVVLVVSGTHGVEGYCGSALQRHHLHLLADAYDPATAPALVFVHALNPYGMSWVRRVNEDNIDLNRNFVDWTRPTPRNDDYTRLADLLVPAMWTAAEQERTLLALLGEVQTLGMERMQQIVQGGQFEHPTGLFYGGTGPTWSHRWLREFAAGRLAATQRVTVVDLHTGLGPWGHGSLLSSSPRGTASFDRQVAWWGDVTADDAAESVSADVAGGWLSVVDSFAPRAEVTEICIEYGTVDPITVLQGLRADAVLHAHGDPAGPEAGAVRAQVRGAFADDDPSWLAACWPRYEQVLGAAIEQLSH
jgi:hypothetical protein